MITVLQHNKDEWSRMASDAYAKGHNAFGHRYSGLAALPTGSKLPVAVYDSVQHVYRQWLVFGWNEVFNPR